MKETALELGLRGCDTQRWREGEQTCPWRTRREGRSGEGRAVRATFVCTFPVVRRVAGGANDGPAAH